MKLAIILNDVNTDLAYIAIGCHDNNSIWIRKVPITGVA